MTADPTSDAEVAVITGGASGFGLALGQQCGARGMHVALFDIDGERAREQAESLADTTGVLTLGGYVDVSKLESVQAAAQAVQEQFGRADLVVSNVGVQLFGSVERLTDEEWQWVFDVNVVGAARSARAFLPLLQNSAHARLAFTTSSSVLDPASRMAAYQSSKFALWGLAETLRLELSDQGIAVSVIFPSGMISRHLETSEAAQPDAIRRSIGTDDDFAQMIASNPTLAEAVVTPEEAAANVVDAVLAGDRYVITHGDLSAAIAGRFEQLRVAATAAAGTN